MRVFSIMFRFVVLLSVSAVAVFLVFRETVIQLEQYRLRKDAETIMRVARVPQDYTRNCLNGPGGQVIGSQMRFIDATSYTLEVICSDIPDQPVRLRDGSLGMGVQKVAGSSGLYLSTTEEDWQTGLQLEFLGRTLSYGLGASTASITETADLERPRTTCDGFGYTCCTLNTQVPDGEFVGDRSTDCPLSCASVCRSRPIVLSFNAQPGFSPQDRVVTVPRSNQTVEFAFTAQDADGQVVEAILSFGDGNEERFIDLSSGRTSHTYSCNQARCEFTATLELVDDQEYRSPELESSKITVKIQ